MSSGAYDRGQQLAPAAEPRSPMLVLSYPHLRHRSSRSGCGDRRSGRLPRRLGASSVADPDRRSNSRFCRQDARACRSTASPSSCAGSSIDLSTAKTVIPRSARLSTTRRGQRALRYRSTAPSSASAKSSAAAPPRTNWVTRSSTRLPWIAGRAQHDQQAREPLRSDGDSRSRRCRRDRLGGVARQRVYGRLSLRTSRPAASTHAQARCGARDPPDRERPS